MRGLVIIILLFVAHVTLSQDSVVTNSMFSPKGGIYSDRLLIELSDSSNTIYYTTDGSDPSSSSAKYASPISIEKNTVVRAVGYSNGKKTEIETQTYFVGRDYDMAVISIAVNPDDFFGYERGIYVKGCCADSVPPYRGANFWKGWERKINIEFYEPNGAQAFNQLANARIFGGFSKGLPMKSLAIFAEKKYGKKNFEYPIFPNKDIDKYKSFILRSSGSDFNKAHFRDALLTNLVEPLDMEIQAYRPAVVYINGEYWGIHNVREKINEDYLKRNCGANPDSVDIMKHRNDLQAGNRKYYLELIKYLGKTDLSDTAAIRMLNTLMDVDNYINYNQTEIYIDNRDAGGNIRYWRPQTKEARWRWILFDTDISFGITDWKAYKKNTLFKMTNKNAEIWPDPAWSTFIIRKILENDSMKNVYINRFADHLNTIFSSENVLFKIDSIKNLLKNEMPFHVERWRSNTMEKWEVNINVMKEFAENRPSYVRKHIMEKFNLTDTFFVEVRNENPGMGYVRINSIDVNNGFKGIYFGGVPIHVVPIANEGYVFDGWEEPISEWVNLDKNIVLKARFSKASKSVYQGKVFLSELSVKQDSIMDSGDWLEMYNASNETISMGNWELRSKKGNYHFSEQVEIAAGAFIVLCRYPAKFNNVFTMDSTMLLDSLEYGFSSKSDRLVLLDAKKQVVDSLVYKMKKDFPEMQINNTLENNITVPCDLKNWSVSKMATPGKLNNTYVPPVEEEEEGSSTSELLLYAGIGILIFGIALLILIVARKKSSV